MYLPVLPSGSRARRRSHSLLWIVFIAALIFGSSGSAHALPEPFEWASYRSPGFAVYVPSGMSIDGLGPMIESLYAEVSQFWLPSLVLCQQLSPDDQILVPCESAVATQAPILAAARRNPGSCVPAPSSVFLYPSIDALQWDLRDYSVGGRFCGSIAFDPEMMHTLGRVASHLPESGACSPDPLLSIYVCGFPDEGWKSILVHEFVHLLQITNLTDLDMLPLDARLLLEGMAAYTEYALGYGDDFDVHVTEPVAYWIQHGGRFDAVPEYLLYPAGALLAAELCAVIEPASFWALFSPIAYGCMLDLFDYDAADVAVHASVDGALVSDASDWQILAALDFSARLERTTGVCWDEWLGRLAADLREHSVSPAGMATFEWKRRNVALRFRLLAPVLSEATYDEFLAISERVAAGIAHVTDVDRAEALLALPAVQFSADVVDELAWRIPSLENEVRDVSGEAAVQSVSLLSSLRQRNPDDPAAYIAAFAEIVNRDLVWAGPTVP